MPGPAISASTTIALAPGTDPATIAPAKDAFLNGVLGANPNAAVLSQTDTILTIVTPHLPAQPTVAAALLVTLVYAPNPTPTAFTLAGPVDLQTTATTSNISGAPTTITTPAVGGTPAITATPATTTATTGTLTPPP